jgi:hypothetical protein
MPKTKRAKAKRECQICDRLEGSTKDRDDAEDGVPLGPVEKCDACGRWACPDCMHEADCCFADAEDHADDPKSAPPGCVTESGLFDEVS